MAGSFLTLAALLLFQLAAYPDSLSLSLGPRFARTLYWTTVQASLSTLLSVLTGILLAWALSHRRRFRGRSVYIALLSSALVLPTLVIVLGIVSILGRSGWINNALRWMEFSPFDTFIFGLSGIVLAHVYFNASYVARTLLGRFESIPIEQHKLGKSLGLSAWQRFKMIELPAISGTLPGLTITIFLLCFTSFSIVLILGGSPKYNTLEVSIYEAIKLDFDLGRALGLALTQLGICAVLILLGSRLRRDNRLIAAASDKQSPVKESNLLAVVQCLIILLFGLIFVLPLLAVITDGMSANFIKLAGDRNFQIALFTSLSIALLSTLLVLFSSVLFAAAYATLATRQRLGGGWLSKPLLKLLSFSSTLYLAVPSLVLGFGFFLLSRSIGGAQTLWAVIALLTSNVLMVLPFAVTALAPAMVKSANRYDKLAFSLGLKKWHRWRLIEANLVKPELIYIASLAFCMSLGDLGVIALFGNQDFITLPWLLYQKMGSYRTDEAAGIALIMLALTLAVFLVLPKLFSSARTDARIDHYAKA